jgi:hypothetical protein
MKIIITRRTINGPTLGVELDLPADEAMALIHAGTAEVTPEAPQANVSAPVEEAPLAAPAPAPKLKSKHK